jgi:glutamyl-tRNA reductase
VASGLDSLVLGETQILGQVRNALRAAQQAGAAGSQLIPLFEHALTCGKRVQTETTLRQGSLSIGTAAVDLATRIFGNLSGAKALILGAGKMRELTAKDLVSNGVKFVLVANRTYEKAVELAARLGGQAIQYDAFPENLVTADIVISSTASPTPILTRDMLQPILRRRKGKPLFLIDIAVPRDIEAAVGDIDNVFLYNIDDLQDVAAEGAVGRAERAQAQAEVIANEETTKFLARHRTRSVAPVLSRLRSQASSMADGRLEVLRSRLGPMSDRDWSIIALQFRSLADELLLAPTLRLKREATETAAVATPPPQYELADAARELFGLEEQAPPSDDLVSPPATQRAADAARPPEPLQEVKV